MNEGRLSPTHGATATQKGRSDVFYWCNACLLTFFNISPLPQGGEIFNLHRIFIYNFYEIDILLFKNWRTITCSDRKLFDLSDFICRINSFDVKK